MSRKIGDEAEKKAELYLATNGFNILDRNVFFPFGELDLVAMDKSTLVFIEVKYRKSKTFGFHYESVNKSKQKKIINAANAYISKNYRANLPSCRFDVIILWKEKNEYKLEHLKDAFWDETQ